MKRLASVIGLPAVNTEEYERLHAAVWPAVLERLAASKITHFEGASHVGEQELDSQGGNE